MWTRSARKPTGTTGSRSMTPALRSLAALVAVLLALPAYAQETDVPLMVEVKDGAIITTDGGRHEVEGGVYLSPEGFGVLDLEVKRLQVVELRLGAENKALRETAAQIDPGWSTKSLLAVAVVGVVAGLAAGAGAALLLK